MLPPRIGPGDRGDQGWSCAHRPMAWALNLGGTIFFSRVWDSGIIGPPRRPCMMRNSTRKPSEGARPHRTEQMPKAAMAGDEES